MNQRLAYGLKNSRIYIVDIVGHCVPLRTKTRVTVIYYVDGRDSLLDKFLMIIGDSAAHHQGKHGTVTRCRCCSTERIIEFRRRLPRKILGREPRLARPDHVEKDGFLRTITGIDGISGEIIRTESP